MEAWMQWLIAGIGLFIVEMVTPGAFFFACFGVAAIVAAVVNYYIGGFELSWGAFFAAALALLLSARPLARKFLKGEDRPSNVDELIGCVGVVTAALVPHQLGSVKVRSEEWRAQSDVAAPVGTEVIVEKVDGTKLVVRPK